ncbi:MAG: RNA polymerase sigma-70 factor [Chitinophagaceae bacterium]
MKDLHQIALLQHRIFTNGDSGAFRQLFLLLAAPLRQFAYTIIHSKEKAEEIVEDVFVNIWQHRNTLGDVKNLRVYLYVATKNTALNYLRKMSGQPHHDVIEYAHVEIADDDPNPEQILITSQMRRRIDEVIQQLPPKCKLIFKMAKEDRLRYREIADILNITVKTIDNQLAIALKRISEAINFKQAKTGSKISGTSNQSTNHE